MGIRIALTVILTILPFVALLRYYYTRDVFREPRDALVRTFFLGLAVTIPAIPIEVGLSLVPLRSAGPLGIALYSALVIAAIPEESLKLLVISRYCARRKTFDEPIDGIVYGATAALGFAALENAFYVADGGLVTAAIRSVTSVPMHATWGAILGYYLARARFGGKRSDIWKGWALAVVSHGLFDFGLMGSVLLIAEDAGAPSVGLMVAGLLLLFAAVVVVSWFSVRKLIRRLHQDQVVRRAQEREVAMAESLRLGPAADQIQFEGHAEVPSDDAGSDPEAASAATSRPDTPDL
jgi:RsiW-degrading membrane proteinase PrsW (M82 family)